MLSISLFATLNIQPVEAIVPNQDAVALKEYKQYASYNPSYTFSKPTSSVLEMMSTQGGNGPAYAFFHIDKSYLHGNKLRVYWRWYLDYSGPSYTLAYVYVVNNVANRKLINEGEFRTENNEEHPITDFTYTTACWRTATCNGGWINWDTYTSNILDLSAYSSTVTIMIKSIDPWIANTVGLQVDYLQILNSNNQVIKTYDFSSSVRMDKTGINYDYGMLRNPTSMLYGTRNYGEDTGAPEGELEESETVNDEIYSFFSNRGYPVGNYWGEQTTQYYVNSLTYNCERYYDYSMVLYKGHTFVNYGYYYPCGVGGCSYVHNAVHNDAYSNVDPEDFIRDYHIDEAVRNAISAANKHGTHDFVFMWTCGLANITHIGVYNHAHSSSFLPSWMHFDPWSLQNNSYANVAPDYSDHLFIGFEWLSKSYRDSTEDASKNYGDWLNKFYYYLLVEGKDVRNALDSASQATCDGRDYGETQLHLGYWAENPLTHTYQRSRMCLWGDYSTYLPR